MPGCRSCPAKSIEEQMAPFLAQDHTTAQLAIVFGCVALALAAAGLFGVLSYGIARRTGEIAVRIALGPTWPRHRHGPQRDHRTRYRRAGAGRGLVLHGFDLDQ